MGKNKFRQKKEKRLSGHPGSGFAGNSVPRFAGCLAALFTILIWGTTFISTKVLLADFQPAEILFFRFVTGYLILFLICPRRLKIAERRREMMFALAGLCGICLYYLLENIALTYTLASNVGVIISIAPFFTAILSRLLLKRNRKRMMPENDKKIVSGQTESCRKPEEKLRVNFFIGFAVAMAGIALIGFNGSEMKLNPAGDILAVLAAFMWACYSILIRKIGSYGYPVIPTTRRVFFYGILFMIPMLFFFDFRLDPVRFTDMKNLLNMIYLGVGASAVCFVTWNFAVKVLGAVKTSVYIYMVPVITLVTSLLVLKEPVSRLSVLGIALAVAGLFLSEYRKRG